MFEGVCISRYFGDGSNLRFLAMDVGRIARLSLAQILQEEGRSYAQPCFALNKLLHKNFHIHHI